MQKNPSLLLPRCLLIITVSIISMLQLYGCGGGGASSGGAPPPAPVPDFSMSLQPPSATIAQGSTTSFLVSVTGLNGFSSQVAITVSGLPTGVSASPAQLNLSVGAQQTITLTAGAATTTGTTNLSVAGSSGSLTHSIPLALTVSPAPDFSVSVQPGSASVAQGSSSSFIVTVAGSNGFSSQVAVTITGLPVGVTASPAQFNLVPGAQQTVTLTVAPATGIGTASLTVTATSTTLTHSTQLALFVIIAQQVTHPPLRTRYIRTDIQWDVGFLNLFPQRLILYDAGTKRFFISNTLLNRVDVIDAITELKIAEIPVPGAWVGDETPDHKTIYLGTQVGDVYLIDPVSMTVTKRIPATQIGPQGFPTYEIRILADGKLVLLGGQGGIPAVDGYSIVGLWSPTNNSLSIAGGPSDIAGCALHDHIGEFELTADRTKVLLGTTLLNGGLCLYDPNTGAERVVTPNIGFSGELAQILVPPDGKEILIPGDASVTVFDASELFQLDRFQIGDGTGFYRYLLSQDGGTLFAIPQGGVTGQAYDWRTHQRKGWFTGFQILEGAPDLNAATPMAIDETGLILAAMGHGVAFLDGSAIHPGSPNSVIGAGGSVQPSSGAVQGGTQTLLAGAQFPNVNAVFFGNGTASGVSSVGLGLDATTPAGLPGPVDVVVTYTDQNVFYLPEAFCYGPSILEVPRSSATADGGSTGFIYGYGFGSSAFNGQAPGLQVSVGGIPATITKYSPQANPPGSYPFPIESIQFVWPPGVGGSVADLTVSNPIGSTTLPGTAHYLPAIQRFSLPGAVLVQGIYDARRDLYYFTDQNAVQVFSRSQGRWFAPLSFPPLNPGFFRRLWGISLSPDGNRLAIADPGLDVIYTLNPDSPSNITTFPLPVAGFDPGLPGGLAITDSGIVYYVSFYLSSTGSYAFHKLDTATGIVTDYTELQAGSLGNDAYARVMLSADGTRVFFNLAGLVVAVDTATDTFFFNPTLVAGDYELTLSTNQTRMSATEYLMDTNLNPSSFLVLNEREIWNELAVYGEKLSPDGNLLFSPLMDAIDVFDGRLGLFRTRIALPVTLSPNYDALVADGRDNVLVVITGQNGDGIAIVDLTSLPEPLPLSFSFSTAASDRLLAERLKEGIQAKRTASAATEGKSQTVAGRPLRPFRIPHVLNNLATKR